jgi:transcriptional regulator with XRE-family HTH domain
MDTSLCACCKLLLDTLDSAKHKEGMDESELYVRLGQLVRQHRERLGRNQAEIGRASGLSRASIANIETGRQRIPVHHLYGLARALRVDVHALLPAARGEASATTDREIQSAVALSQREQEEVAKVVGFISAHVS